MNLIALALGMACVPPPPSSSQVRIPTLADLGATDLDLSEVNRASALRGAKEAAQASAGRPFDITTSAEGFRMEIDSNTVGAPSAAAASMRSRQTSRNQSRQATSTSYSNYLHAVGMVVAADLTTVGVLAVPAAAIAAVTQGVSTPVGTNAWMATNTVSYNGQWVNGVLVVAWVEIGYIAQLSLTSSDGVLQNTPWLTGFISKDYKLGWWDMKDQWGMSVGALEWTSDASGNSQFGILSNQGDSTGDVLGYAFVNGVSSVALYDSSADELSWVEVNPDESGSLRDPLYRWGAESCWNTQRLDTACE